MSQLISKSDIGSVSNLEITTITPHVTSKLSQDIYELWQYREIFMALALREIKSRYKQSVLGILWVIIQPIMTCLVFTIVFGHFVRINSGDIPYPVFVFSGLLLWQFFSRNLSEGTASLVSNAAFINKIYFPRMGIPLISLLSSSIDFLLSLAGLFVLMLWFGMNFEWRMLFAPLIVFATFGLSYAGSLIFAPINAIYRDIGMAMGYAIQLLMYLSPIIYPVSFLPDKYRWVFDFNPIATLLDWMRWSLIAGNLPSMRAFIFLLFIIIMSLITGRTIFRKLEPTIVDRI